MDIPHDTQLTISRHNSRCFNLIVKLLIWLALVTILLVTAIIFSNILLFSPNEAPVWAKWIVLASLTATLTATVKQSLLVLKKYRFEKNYLHQFHRTHESLKKAHYANDSQTIDQTLQNAKSLSHDNRLIRDILLHSNPILIERLNTIRRSENKNAILKNIEKHSFICESRIAKLYEKEPLVKQSNTAKRTLAYVSQKLDSVMSCRREAENNWNIKYEAFSWWNKMKNSDGPDYSEIDEVITNLESVKSRLKNTAEIDLSALNDHYAKLRELSNQRIQKLRSNTYKLFEKSKKSEDISTSIITKSLWLSAMSVPISAWQDVDEAMDVYEVLRGVNHHYGDLSSLEIFYQTLLLPHDSLAGLSSLLKGAYFESLVAAKTGGDLHEHFNNPDTDIIIDGVAVQLKATDSVTYASTVDDGLPLMTTSEIADAIGAIDSGITNEELTNAIDNSIGGTVVDVGDTAADALLVGVGGLGFFSTLSGINHACKQYEDGLNGLDSAANGLGVAIEGTAKSVVGAAELAFKATQSRPSRFIGRSILKAGSALDKKLSGE